MRTRVNENRKSRISRQLREGEEAATRLRVSRVLDAARCKGEPRNASGAEGEFLKVSKLSLRIPKPDKGIGGYQRDVYDKLVKDIVMEFLWPVFGVLIVARRPDGSLWVMDGQHRLLAALQIDNVDLLPCYVFDIDNTPEEARCFFRLNKYRFGMRADSGFVAQVQGNDPESLAIKEMVEGSGYRVARVGTSRYTVKCIATIQAAFSKSPAITKRVWAWCVALLDGEAFGAKFFKGLWKLEHREFNSRRGTVLTKKNFDRLASEWEVGIPAMFAQRERQEGGGSAMVSADSLVRVLNRGRAKRNLLPVFV